MEIGHVSFNVTLGFNGGSGAIDLLKFSLRASKLFLHRTEIGLQELLDLWVKVLLDFFHSVFLPVHHFLIFAHQLSKLGAGQIGFFAGLPQFIPELFHHMHGDSLLFGLNLSLNDFTLLCLLDFLFLKFLWHNQSPYRCLT